MPKNIRLLVTRQFPPDVLARCERDYTCTFNPKDTDWIGDELVARAADHDAIFFSSGNKFTADVIAALPDSIKALSTFSVGHEHIDLAAATARGLMVSNTPGVLSEATADIAFMLLLCASRRASEANRMVRNGDWAGWAPTQMLGVGMQGKRLAILGMGGIGREVAKRGRAFGMTIHYHNRRSLPDDVAEGAIYHESADELMKVADFLSINCPMMPEMVKFLNEDRIALLPPNPIVVNSARGGLVDDEALIAALKSGRVFAAGLDVFDGEPNLDPKYRKLDNVILLPHVGSATFETRNAMGFTALENLDAFFAGTEPPNCIV
jgi:lactate dehydrogenase-like 2-hydroxyacid dehydrogenase